MPQARRPERRDGWTPSPEQERTALEVMLYASAFVVRELGERVTGRTSAVFFRMLPEGGPVRAGREPSFDEWRTAREVMIRERKLAGLTLSECPVFSWIVLQSSPLCDPALFRGSRLASAEGSYSRSREVWREKNRRQS